jgi:ATP-dependent DNA helicase DinG
MRSEFEAEVVMPRARDILGPSGPLSSSLANYEDRPGQLAMAEAVERALARDRVLACEAGTGTGKTLAYLVPAILSGKKVIVSTATRALQEQIFDKDIPLIKSALGLEVSAALMKGLPNYLCLRRYGEFRASPEAAEAHTARALSIIERWAASTETGDVAEIEGLAEDEPVWREVSSSSETRIGQMCDHFRECFVTRMKRQAEAARIVVVNHHLFFADLALRGPHAGAALPDYDAVIFDEAHQLEDIATEFFGIRVSTARIASLLRDVERTGATSSPALVRRSHRHPTVENVSDAARRFFEAVSRRAVEAAPPSQPGLDIKATTDPSFFGAELRHEYHKLDATLEALGAHAATQAGASEAFELLFRRVAQLREDLVNIIDGTPNYVAWVENRTRSVAIGASPVNVSNTLKSRLFGQVPAIILTSATLAANHSFSFLRSRLGLDSDEVDVDELEVASPFDYPNRALVYLPRDLPDPSDPAWIGAAEKRIAELIDASGGGAFVLSTSKRVMLELHRRLARRGGHHLLVQGQAPKASLLDRFRAEKNAVLVATMSFWEGVDVPGDALRLVIIDKIPFLVPSDPVVWARGAALEAEGRNPFVVYQVPSAAIILKQGFGRLIRTRKDAGVVALLDRRVHTKSYGSTLIESLPPARRTDDLDQVKAVALPA